MIWNLMRYRFFNVFRSFSSERCPSTRCSESRSFFFARHLRLHPWLTDFRYFALPGITTISNLLVLLTGHRVRLNIGIRYRPLGILFSIGAFRTSIIPCQDVHGISPLLVTADQSKILNVICVSLPCKFDHLCLPLRVI